MISTVRECVEAFGGIARSAELFSTTQQNVWNWCEETRRFPAWAMPIASVEATRRGLSIEQTLIQAQRQTRKPKRKVRRPARGKGRSLIAAAE